jgi:hypothetical protein
MAAQKKIFFERLSVWAGLDPRHQQQIFWADFKNLSDIWADPSKSERYTCRQCFSTLNRMSLMPMSESCYFGSYGKGTTLCFSCFRRQNKNMLEVCYGCKVYHSRLTLGRSFIILKPRGFKFIISGVMTRGTACVFRCFCVKNKNIVKMCYGCKVYHSRLTLMCFEPQQHKKGKRFSMAVVAHLAVHCSIVILGVELCQ